MFPLPPTNIPQPRLLPQLPPPDRALPSPPASPAPPVPPKDRIERAHKSLPPSPLSIRSQSSPQASWELSEGRPPSVVHLGRGLSLGDRPIKTLAQLHEVSETQVHEVALCLGEPWSATVSHSSNERPIRSTTPILRRRRSGDSTSTITASPSSSALHEAARMWDSSPLATRDVSAIREGESYSVQSSSAHLPTQVEDDAVTDYWSPVESTTSSTVFYDARSSVASASRFSLDSDVDGRSQSMEDQPIARAPVWRVGKAASSGPCS